jgi:hypothetical protein
LTSKPAWPNTSGCSTTSAFFFARGGAGQARPAWADPGRTRPVGGREDPAKGPAGVTALRASHESPTVTVSQGIGTLPSEGACGTAVAGDLMGAGPTYCLLAVRAPAPRRSDEDPRSAPDRRRGGAKRERGLLWGGSVSASCSPRILAEASVARSYSSLVPEGVASCLRKAGRPPRHALTGSSLSHRSRSGKADRRESPAMKGRSAWRPSRRGEGKGSSPTPTSEMPRPRFEGRPSLEDRACTSGRTTSSS